MAGDEAEPQLRFVARCYCCHCPLTWDQYRQSERCLYELTPIVGIAEGMTEEWVAVNMPACISCIENRQIWRKNIPPPPPLLTARVSDHDVREPRREHQKRLVARWLLYGSPLASAILMLSVRQFVLTTGFLSWGSVDGLALIGHGMLAACGSAAGALLVTNRLAIRVAHAAVAALLSAAAFLVIVQALISAAIALGIASRHSDGRTLVQATAVKETASRGSDASDSIRANQALPQLDIRYWSSFPGYT